ncbi:hypothetical protein [Pedococcus bigeumensis]|uniref:hypothetical protein n=1 Tax=Pedococcus bigeumensis TaxID=433644 RepID=UPI0019D59CFF|nr:hypothetical protein [Pedococcus bigeumensis]
MHHANHFYGHAHILARYAGLADVPRIWGYLQHGWNVHDGFAVGTQFAPGFPKFIWSDAPRRRGWAVGMRDYVIVGSPWAYLLQLEQQEQWEAGNPDRQGTIVYPFHGWEQQAILGSHHGYVEELKATETGPITICLYWNEFQDAAVRRTYERAGFRVISHGYRGHMWQGTTPDFLDRQLTELRRHRRVVSNRMGSALFYGASVGCEMGVYGDPMILEAERAVLGGMERQRRLWPQMHQVSVPLSEGRELARVELGLDHVLGRAELIDVLGWSHAPLGRLDSRGPLTEAHLGDDSSDSGNHDLTITPDDRGDLLAHDGVPR